MSSTVNLPSIFISNVLGLLTIFVLVIGNNWRFKANTKENRYLITMILTALVANITDPLACYFDGKPGRLAFFIVYFANWILFSLNVIIGPTWIRFLSNHMNITLGKRHLLITNLVALSGVFVLVANFFFPVIFTIDSSNVYHRSYMYWFFLAMESVFLIDGALLYLSAKKKGGILKYFPVWVFYVPIIAGTAIQSLMYGVSVIWPGISIAVSGIMGSLQNEIIFRDTLTGLYNRFYLDGIKSQINDKKGSDVTAMMLDINDFKAINDVYGHAVGDDALKAASDILRTTVGSLGSVIRYAGDEFVVIINSQQDPIIEGCIRSIKDNLVKFNDTAGKPYKLSVSIGYTKFNFLNMDADELMNSIDMKMYEDKKKYYETHKKLGLRADI